MGQPILRINQVWLRETRRSFKAKIFSARFSSREGDKDKEANFDVEGKYKGQEGVLHDKHQSIQEESFFHKESQEQIKSLKKKITEKKPDGSSDSSKNK